ncbi:hypothetical protein GPECTOR_50g603 [Gonium pectorale]|uniref:Uncharacterized protein n=1 Tax=Gonium pectorale TaxID=33097 RepID=A0A150G7G7_GONPE|nr:hypothetical protein GPECTOR_50g603 [Gonium pectorale]|eukprot:KXZ45809.1 hypothetical protein GPECTOR_50g603 [Gonium pectorale]
MREAYSRLRAKLSWELSQVLEDNGRHVSTETLRWTGLAVLRSHALRVQSCLLAAAAAQLEPQPAQGPNSGPARRPRRILQVAADALMEARVVLSVLQRQAEDESLAGRGSSMQTHPLTDELGKEILASGVLDHWSRLLLLLASCEGWHDEAAKQLHAMAHILSGLDHCAVDEEWHRELLLSSPCLAYLLASHVVGLCAALDGGPTYGLPGAAAFEQEDEEQARGAAAVAPLFTTTGLRLPRRGAPEGADTALALWALNTWASTVALELCSIVTALNGPGSEVRATEAPAHCWSQLRSLHRLASMPPLHTGAAFELCMRLAAASKKIMEEATTAPSVGLDLNRVLPGHIVSAVSAAEIALEALSSSHTRWNVTYFVPDNKVSSATVAGMRRWWCALVAVVDAAEAGAGQRARNPIRIAWSRLVIDLTKGVDVGLTGTLPSCPSPWLSAALESGFLSRMPTMVSALTNIKEDVMRYVGLSSRNAGTEWAWAQILAFGSPRDTVPLVDLVAARLQAAVDALPRGADAPLDGRSAALRALEEALQDARAMFGVAVQGFASAAVTSGERCGGDGKAGQRAGPAEPHLVDGAGSGAGSSASTAARDRAAADPTAEARSLGVMLSYMCTELLLRMQDAQLEYLSACVAARSGLSEAVLRLLEDMLGWPVLVAAALKRTRDTQPAGQGTGPPGAGTCADGAEAEEWKKLLITPCLLWLLTGVVVPFCNMDGKHDIGGLQHALQRTASYLAALAPKELAGLLLSCDLAGPLGSPSPPSTATTGVQGEGNIIQKLLGLRQVVEDDAAAAGGDKMELMAQRLLEAPWLAPQPADVEAWVAAAALLPPPSRSRVLLQEMA